MPPPLTFEMTAKSPLVVGLRKNVFGKVQKLKVQKFYAGPSDDETLSTFHTPSYYACTSMSLLLSDNTCVGSFY